MSAGLPRARSEAPAGRLEPAEGDELRQHVLQHQPSVERSERRSARRRSALCWRRVRQIGRPWDRHRDRSRGQRPRSKGSRCSEWSACSGHIRQVRYLRKRVPISNVSRYLDRRLMGHPRCSRVCVLPDRQMPLETRLYKGSPSPSYQEKFLFPCDSGPSGRTLLVEVSPGEIITANRIPGRLIPVEMGHHGY